MHYISTSHLKNKCHCSHSHSHSMNFESQNSHSMNANFDQRRHIPISYNNIVRPVWQCCNVDCGNWLCLWLKASTCCLTALDESFTLVVWVSDDWIEKYSVSQRHSFFSVSVLCLFFTLHVICLSKRLAVYHITHSKISDLMCFVITWLNHVSVLLRMTLVPIVSTIESRIAHAGPD